MQYVYTVHCSNIMYDRVDEFSVDNTSPKHSLCGEMFMVSLFHSWLITQVLVTSKPTPFCLSV